MAAELLPAYRALLDVLAGTEPLRGNADRLAFKESLHRDGPNRGLVGPATAGLPALPLPARVPADRRAALADARRTRREFTGGRVPLAAVSALLAYLADLPGQDPPRRLYPAAGSVFAIDVLLHVAPARIDGLHGGVYRYDAADHRVVMLDDLAPEPANFGAANRPVLRNAAFLVLLVADLSRLVPLYGRYALQFATLEAGYLSQLLMLEAAGCGLGLCPVGAQSFADVQDCAGLNEAFVLVHSLIGGVPVREPPHAG